MGEIKFPSSAMSNTVTYNIPHHNLCYQSCNPGQVQGCLMQHKTTMMMIMLWAWSLSYSFDFTAVASTHFGRVPTPRMHMKTIVSTWSTRISAVCVRAPPHQSDPRQSTCPTTPRRRYSPTAKHLTGDVSWRIYVYLPIACHTFFISVLSLFFLFPAFV